MMLERWRPIDGFPNYEVSDQGRVRSVERSFTNSRGARRTMPGCIRKPFFSPKKYASVTLYRDGRFFTKAIHRLVLETFVGPCPEGFEALHRNGNKDDNALDNLRWGTSADNTADTFRHNTASVGSRHYAAKLDYDKAAQIRRMAQTMTHKAIAEHFGVCRTIITRVVNGTRWSRQEIAA